MLFSFAREPMARSPPPPCITFRLAHAPVAGAQVANPQIIMRIVIIIVVIVLVLVIVIVLIIMVMIMIIIMGPC